MAKTLNELAGELRDFIVELQLDAHNKGNFRPERYNNLKLTMSIPHNPSPHVVISISMSEAEFDLKTGEKISGGLGPDDRYVMRWLSKANVLTNLNERWKAMEKNRGRIVDKY